MQRHKDEQQHLNLQLIAPVLSKSPDDQVIFRARTSGQVYYHGNQDRNQWSNYTRMRKAQTCNYTLSQQQQQLCVAMTPWVTPHSTGLATN